MTTSVSSTTARGGRRADGGGEGAGLVVVVRPSRAPGAAAAVVVGDGADGTSSSTSWRARENGVQPAGGRVTSTAGAALASVRSIVVLPQPGAATTSVRRWVRATCTRADDRGSTSRAADIRVDSVREFAERTGTSAPGGALCSMTISLQLA